MRPGVEWELDRGRGVSGFLETIPAHMSLKRKILDTDDPKEKKHFQEPWIPNPRRGIFSTPHPFALIIFIQPVTHSEGIPKRQVTQLLDG